jgi:RNA polymerase sigma-70 factor (ECF subfamily)
MLDSIKHARLRRCTPLDDSLADSIPQPAVDDAAQAIYISEFATQLTETQRAVFDCLIDGLTWREAGQVLGCTSANVAYHVRQIRRQYEEWCR